MIFDAFLRIFDKTEPKKPSVLLSIGKAPAENSREDKQRVALAVANEMAHYVSKNCFEFKYLILITG